MCCRPAAPSPILCRVLGDGFEEDLAAAQRGHEAAFARLWRDANPSLLRYLRVIAPDVADDVAAETWLRVLRGLKGFRGDEQAWRAWVFTICRHLVIDERRRSKAPTLQLSEVPPARLATGRDPAEEAIEHFSTRSALAMVAALPPLQAEVILLRVVAGLETEAVAKLVGRSPGAVRVAAHRGLRRLAQIAAEAGVTL
jgi:RNA polymerase sigma-70 factor, ECF subfamily